MKAGTEGSLRGNGGKLFFRGMKEMSPQNLSAIPPLPLFFIFYFVLLNCKKILQTLCYD